MMERRRKSVGEEAMRKSEKRIVREAETKRAERKRRKKRREGERTDHVEGGGVQRLRKTHKQAYCNNGRACCTNTISG